jgi:hypothetical protein
MGWDGGALQPGVAAMLRLLLARFERSVSDLRWFVDIPALAVNISVDVF